MNSLRAHNAAVSPILGGPAVLIDRAQCAWKSGLSDRQGLSGDKTPVLSARREALVASLCGEEKEVGNLCDAATEVCA